MKSSYTNKILALSICVSFLASGAIALAQPSVSGRADNFDKIHGAKSSQTSRGLVSLDASWPAENLETLRAFFEGDYFYEKGDLYHRVNIGSAKPACLCFPSDERLEHAVNYQHDVAPPVPAYAKIPAGTEFSIRVSPEGELIFKHLAFQNFKVAGPMESRVVLGPIGKNEKVAFDTARQELTYEISFGAFGAVRTKVRITRFEGGSLLVHEKRKGRNIMPPVTQISETFIFLRRK